MFKKSYASILIPTLFAFACGLGPSGLKHLATADKEGNEYLMMPAERAGMVEIRKCDSFSGIKPFDGPVLTALEAKSKCKRTEDNHKFVSLDRVRSFFHRSFMRDQGEEMQGLDSYVLLTTWQRSAYDNHQFLNHLDLYIYKMKESVKTTQAEVDKVREYQKTNPDLPLDSDILKSTKEKEALIAHQSYLVKLATPENITAAKAVANMELGHEVFQTFIDKNYIAPILNKNSIQKINGTSERDLYVRGLVAKLWKMETSNLVRLNSAFDQKFKIKNNIGASAIFVKDGSKAILALHGRLWALPEGKELSEAYALTSDKDYGSKDYNHVNPVETVDGSIAFVGKGDRNHADALFVLNMKDKSTTMVTSFSNWSSGRMTIIGRPVVDKENRLFFIGSKDSRRQIWVIDLNSEKKEAKRLTNLSRNVGISEIRYEDDNDTLIYRVFDTTNESYRLYYQSAGYVDGKLNLESDWDAKDYPDYFPVANGKAIRVEDDGLTLYFGSTKDADGRIRTESYKLKDDILHRAKKNIQSIAVNPISGKTIVTGYFRTDKAPELYELIRSKRANK